jgi:precorrin-6A/cobalt-precorrin-6A reductase
MTQRILILGGTTEARQLAGRLAERADYAVTLSLAGRTAAPLAQPVPTRVGGFGGAVGLAHHLRQEGIGLLIDATHPYAARISANAVAAAETTRVPLIALRRPPWQPRDGDRWTGVPDVDAAVVSLGASPRRVFLALGRNEVGAYTRAPQHSYVIRSVDPIVPPLDVPDATYLLGRGPFGEAEDRALLLACRIDVVVAKNSGGDASYGKIAAARSLGIEVILIDRPPEPVGCAAATVDEALEAIAHRLACPAKRGE